MQILHGSWQVHRSLCSMGPPCLSQLNPMTCLSSSYQDLSMKMKMMKWTKKGFQKNFKIFPTFPTFPIFGHSHGIPYITHLLAYPSSKEFAANPSKVLPRRPKHSGSVSSVCWEVYALLKNSVQYFIALISSNFNMIEHIMILDMILNMPSMPQ